VIVRTRLAHVPLSGLDRDAVLAGAFASSERAALAGRPDRSVAGRLALKHALSHLWADLVPGVPAEPRDFVPDTAPSGAPCLRSAPGGVAASSVRVSISHSRHLAVGLAAAPVPEAGPSTQARAGGLRSNLSPEPESPRAHQEAGPSTQSQAGGLRRDLSPEPESPRARQQEAP